MKKRKYITEFAIAYKNTRWCLVTANDLMSDIEFDEASQDVADKSHIYIIAARPACYIKSCAHNPTTSTISGEVGYRLNGLEHVLSFKDYPFELIDGAVKVTVEPYPHRNIWTLDAASEKVRYLSASTLALVADYQNEAGVFNQFETLYVGQAFGDGSRSAQTRLKSHSTLQKILARTAHEYPDREIVLFMFEFEHDQIISGMDGAPGAIDTNENEERLFNAIENPPSKKQKISLIEAALIRYFQPKYNDIFRTKFPSTKLKTLQSCYDLDISGLIVELSLSELDFVLYSDSVKPKWTHFAQYDLVSVQNRASFFHIHRIGGSFTNVIEATK
ncbi:hypothetical protein C4J98_4195 [Pseudomonas orientalis]|uniref:hypothetical protein n=1 Tax=Pseudomonas orientalis TaxID=76758 RepID=UPI000F568154|nr:hypothetical protein [Pseudomonas orientalis]AZE85580.1 hypothetical protein C4J98_4195 [Pseudomonas orientalis]